MNDPSPAASNMTNTSSSPGQRPISKAESSNPREFQMNQLRRRFHPTESTDNVGTTLTFGMAPSDPDFPFEMDKLQCVLHVPLSYPGRERPTLKVTNVEMGSAFQDNIARGFEYIVDSTLRSGGRATLLTWMNSLDRHLERLLTTTERGPTLKFVPNAGGKQKPDSQAIVEGVKSLAISTPASKQEAKAMPLPVPKAPSRVYTAEEKSQVEKRRAVETKQIEARLGRLPLFQKSKDGHSFVIPIQPPKPDRLPISIRSVKTVKLSVPLLYPLEQSSVELQGVDHAEARPVEVGFAKWVEGNSKLNLMSQINYLTANMHNFAKTPLEAPQETVDDALPELHTDSKALDDIPMTIKGSTLEDKPHVHVVPRPPEWTVGERSSESEGTDMTESEDDFTGEDEEDGGAPVPALLETTVERGVALSFPFLELYGIEILELVGLSITIKCDRCKEQMDIKNVPQVKDKADALSPKVELCKKCANTMSFGFRRQLIHPNSNRAGYLDLDGCTIADLLPSSFIPTCAECSSSFPAPGVVAVRGESASASCRECHRKMVFKVPEVKFLRVGSAAFTSRNQALPRKKPKETLGIVAGQELPRRGRCSHYSKSYRWFRFGCCDKVFPCDKCHDAATDHPNEHANRKAGSGFWEGGKGTRNKVLMSRKDPRKYKRRPGSTPGGSSSKKK
ncbi:hypothetical protein BDV26DRAFT_284145 [Aspergillus bertholletiae]|uniref:CHY-type domain-containing protein n=1 Tax=Aspergillus bertholletiae TaxID=1226010 RepID=A0A5N7AZ47_9EURO|nr:hypothetical protein BDV26DRAFT_284145 [Aspergillus bertholletiae]